jgi:hypothetical protein
MVRSPVPSQYAACAAFEHPVRRYSPDMCSRAVVPDAELVDGRSHRAGSDASLQGLVLEPGRTSAGEGVGVHGPSSTGAVVHSLWLPVSAPLLAQPLPRVAARAEHARLTRLRLAAEDERVGMVGRELA